MSSLATLVDLPDELLLNILSPLMRAARPVPVCPCLECCGKRPSRRWTKGVTLKYAGVRILPGQSLLAIFLIHPTIYRIASDLFYSQNGFFLVVHSSFVASAIKPVDKGLFGQPAALRRVRKLTVDFESLRNFVWRTVTPLLEDLATNGQLTDLTVRLFEKARGLVLWVNRGNTHVSVLAVLRAMDAVRTGKVTLICHGYDRSRLMCLKCRREDPGSPARYDLLADEGECGSWTPMKRAKLDWKAMLIDLESRMEAEGRMTSC